jgi:hypothetical protein
MEVGGLPEAEIGSRHMMEQYRGGTMVVEDRAPEMTEATKLPGACSPFKNRIRLACTIKCAGEILILKAKVAELADAPDLGSGG